MSAFGVYVHWPYCGAICPYCDFNVKRDRGEEPEPLTAAIIADIVEHGRRFAAGPAHSVFFGGGTPSRMKANDVARIVRAVEGAFGVSPDAELSLEANPEDHARFADFAAAGINRFSIGAQAFDDAALKALGRLHDSAQSVRAIEAAAQTGKRVSLDLIYARADQTLAAWRKELTLALSLPVEHVSAYQLTIEEKTPFARAVARGRWAPPATDIAADFYALTQEVCEAGGAPAYEISNHARGAPAQSRHNLLYWRGAAWIGVGPGAHGRIDDGAQRWATTAERTIAGYARAVAANGVSWAESEMLDARAIADEALLMGLRLREGVSRARMETLRGAPLDPAVILELRDVGLLSDGETDRLALTAEGRAVADRVALMLSA